MLKLLLKVMNSVPKLVVKLNQKISKVSTKDLKVETAGVKRQIKKVYLSDKNGQKSTKKEGDYLTIQMPVTYNVDDSSKNASPFVYNTIIQMFSKISGLRLTLFPLKV